MTTLAGSAGISGSNDGLGTFAGFNYPGGLTTDGTNLYVTDRNHTKRKIVIATGVVSTLAGSAGVAGWSDGVGVAARFDFPTGISTDGFNLYVVERNNSTVRKLEVATGAVTTLSGSAGLYASDDGAGSAARFYSPRAVTTDVQAFTLLIPVTTRSGKYPDVSPP